MTRLAAQIKLSAISAHSCCFPSFWPWSVVHVNIHSFPSCSVDMRCVLFGDIHTHFTVSWLFSKPEGGKTTLPQHYCSDTGRFLLWHLYVAHEKTSFVDFQPLCVCVWGSTSVLGIHPCSQVQWDYFLSLFLCHARNGSKLTPSNQT